MGEKDRGWVERIGLPEVKLESMVKDAGGIKVVDAFMSRRLNSWS